MELEKIGRFIAACRKKKGWTQSQLAEQLGLSDKAVSKWERGKSLADVSLFLPLCDLLDITLNELLLGEVIPEASFKEKADQVLIDVITSWIGAEQQVRIHHSEKREAILNVSHVSKRYDGEMLKAVDDVSFNVVKGSITGIMGASGSGKSTLLNMISTIDRVSGGNIEINGQDVTSVSQKDLAKFRRENLGFIFQEYNLMDRMTIYENIALALVIKEVPKEDIRGQIEELAAVLDITSILDKYPYEVSGGQRQRCAAARAIAVNPSIILADEPTGALDSYAARQLLSTLSFLRSEYNATILLVTHDAVAASYCDKILFLKDGKIVAEIEKKEESKQAFFARILDTVASMEEHSHVC